MPTNRSRSGIPFAVVAVFIGFLTFLWIVLEGGARDKPAREFISTADSWLDKQACGWLGMCGLSHLDRTGWLLGNGTLKHGDLPPRIFSKEELRKLWMGEEEQVLTTGERIVKDIPQYVMDYAPYVHLYSGEDFWPGDIAEHLLHTTPFLNYTMADKDFREPNLTNLNDLNRYGRSVYLKSNDNVEERPEWLGGRENIPERSHGEDKGDHFPGITDPRDVPLGAEDPDRKAWESVGQGDIWFKNGKHPTYPPRGTPFPRGPAANFSRHWDEHSGIHSDELKAELKNMVKTNRRRRRSTQDGKPSKQGGRSDAPVVLVVVDKGDGVVDAFWFFFYSYNLGNTVLNIRFGNHVGDWEHTMVRFHKGKPKVVFFSQHSGGDAYHYEAVEKFGKRPIAYSATGTHAMYATPGTHAYILPFGLLHDLTDRGPLWDPTLNLHAYNYDAPTDRLTHSSLTPSSPLNWFYFAGHWGDKIYPLSDKRQYRFAGEYHYVDGPLGPRFKNLGRRGVCQGDEGGSGCEIKSWLGGNGLKVWRGRRDAEDEPGHPEGYGGDEEGEAGGVRTHIEQVREMGL
ncbi:hypothetical protein K402DRAFT_327813 [Aulographum hederae CBS 113979]|uniref:Vacuolar protein sorting-associated protein TDA6 n=1 Tax=Aulographum hederae CBS 113979 TaxID=1176131 RepID=A0A6G1H6W2_9PEZI|nr:hypothetical protein K402DRAFT_327813 [Aulographum hederae CBS 113979]